MHAPFEPTMKISVLRIVRWYEHKSLTENRLENTGSS
jgi:hypothetical protein